uniref:Uncharacterized protein n=2 Tax=Arundo donax TaxID=35708 RepID=A0A0A9G5L4_ARUDO
MASSNMSSKGSQKCRDGWRVLELHLLGKLKSLYQVVLEEVRHGRHLEYLNAIFTRLSESSMTYLYRVH